MDNSSDFDWDINSNEYFSFIGVSWNVKKAEQLIAHSPREVFLIESQAFEKFIGGETNNGKFRMGVSVDRSRFNSNEIDLSIPLIIVTLDGNNHMLIDGWHRLAKALTLNVTKLPAVILTSEEEKEIRFK